MSYRYVRSLLLGCGGIGLSVCATIDANAGAFALREQSSYGQSSSYAGVAAGGSPSSMFWNPATMTALPGIQSELVATGILPYAANGPVSGTLVGTFGGTDNTGNATLVPSGYASWQINPRLWLGLSLNSPFGISASVPDAWAGRNYAEDSSLKTYNATPNVAYRINNWISVGAGVQIQYAKADLGLGLPTGLGNELNISGSGWGYGFTAGVTLTPTPTTTIGFGYRSAINQKISGTMALPAGVLFTPPFSTPGAVFATLDLPESVSFGLRQNLTPQWTAMATVEWTDWSRIGTANIFQANSTPAAVLGGNVALPFQFRDGWFFSAGAEYQWTDRLTVRGGVGFEKSPITDQIRIPLLPDNDRTWLSIGSTYRVTKALAFDVAYSHLFVRSTLVNVVPGNPWFDGLVRYSGGVSSHLDILSVALKYRWDDEAPTPNKMLYTK
jgi:long-chain fatty acid transport protein